MTKPKIDQLLCRPHEGSSITQHMAVSRQESGETGPFVSLRFGRYGLSWTETDAALPFPLALDSDDKAFTLAVHSSDFVEALDQEPLKVTGLASARYELKIDGDKVGDFTKQQLVSCHSDS